jgi:hypothetical protein
LTTITTNRFVLDESDVPQAVTYDPTDPDETAAAVGYDATAGATYKGLTSSQIATAKTNAATTDAADITAATSAAVIVGPKPAGES